MTPAQMATTLPLANLYEADETAWLETSSRLILAGRVEELDYANLAEFLDSMAKRDRREVMSRLAVLISHWLKWEFQSDQRTKSWEHTILVQRRELLSLFKSKSLRNHAEAEYLEAYESAFQIAVIETGLEVADFPKHCLFTLDQFLTEPLRP